MVKTKSYKIVWERSTLDDFKEILDHLQKQSEQAPKIVKEGLLSKLEVIKTNPKICEIDKLKDPPNKDFRAFTIYSFRITYQIKSPENEIRLIRIRHTSREPLGY